MLLSCNNNTHDANNSTDTTINNSEKTAINHSGGENPAGSKRIDGCYMRVLQRDTMVLHVEQDGNILSGTMSFDNYEKDGSTGTVTGIVEEGIIKLWYNFQSEGMNSVMELYFKSEDNSVVQGVGPMANRADTAFFTDHSQINYSPDQSLKRIDCANVPEKYL